MLDWLRDPAGHWNNLRRVFRLRGLIGGIGFYWHKIRPFPPVDLAQFIAEHRSRYAGVYVLPSGMAWHDAAFQRAQQMAMAFAGRGFLVIYLEPVDYCACNEILNPVPGVCEIAVRNQMTALEDVKGCLISLYSPVGFLQAAIPLLKRLACENVLIYEYIDQIDESVSGCNAASARAFYQAIVASDWPVRFAASARVLQRELERDSGRSVAYVPNGVDISHFSEENMRRLRRTVSLPKALGGSRVKIGYYGSMARWLDASLINGLMARNPEWDFVFIGSDYVHGRLEFNEKAANCIRIPAVDYRELPAYAECFDVTWIPFRGGAVARATSPVKLFEYLALGKPVVVQADMVECLGYEGVYSARGLDSFEQALKTALAASRTEGFAARVRQQVRECTWSCRAETLIRTWSDVHDGG